jgi:hypothetical protein
MSKAKDIINLMEIDRRKDYKGNQLGGIEDYVLRSKRFKTYVGVGGVHMALIPRLIDARTYSGFTLRDMAYDWTLDFEAVPYEDGIYTGTGSTGGRFP